jgi:hypothetical protein
MSITFLTRGTAIKSTLLRNRDKPGEIFVVTLPGGPRQAQKSSVAAFGAISSIFLAKLVVVKNQHQW